MTRPPPGHTTTTINKPPLDISSSWDVCHLLRRAPRRRGDGALRVAPAGRRAPPPRHPGSAAGAGLLPAGGLEQRVSAGPAAGAAGTVGTQARVAVVDA